MYVNILISVMIFQEASGDGPPNEKLRNVNQPIKEKKPRKEFVGVTAEKKKVCFLYLTIPSFLLSFAFSHMLDTMLFDLECLRPDAVVSLPLTSNIRLGAPISINSNFYLLRCFDTRLLDLLKLQCNPDRV